MLKTPRGDGLPSFRLSDDEYQHFRRVQIQEPVEPIQDIDEAYRRLDESETDATANAFVAMEALERAGGILGQDNAIQYFAVAVRRLETAIRSGNSPLSVETNKRSAVLISRVADRSIAEHWYLLGRAYIGMQEYPKAYEALQQAVYWNGRIPNFWVTIGILYYRIDQLRDALDALSRAVRLQPSFWISWYNLGVLVRHHQHSRLPFSSVLCNNDPLTLRNQYEATNRPADAMDAFERCLELPHPKLPALEPRLQVLRERRVTEATMPASERILGMLEMELSLSLEMGNDYEALTGNSGPGPVRPQDIDHGDSDSDSDFEEGFDEEYSVDYS